MSLKQFTTLLLAALLAPSVASIIIPKFAAAEEKYLNITALVTGPANTSLLECWQLTTPLTVSNTAGTIGAETLFLGAASNITYTSLPARFNGGVHTAPRKQLVVFFTGLAHITLPSGEDEAWVLGGSRGSSLLIAADTEGEGHVTQYPSDEVTVALQIPFEDGEVPAQIVLQSGACIQST